MPQGLRHGLDQVVGYLGLGCNPRDAAIVDAAYACPQSPQKARILTENTGPPMLSSGDPASTEPIPTGGAPRIYWAPVEDY